MYYPKEMEGLGMIEPYKYQWYHIIYPHPFTSWIRLAWVVATAFALYHCSLNCDTWTQSRNSTQSLQIWKYDTCSIIPRIIPFDMKCFQILHSIIIKTTAFYFKQIIMMCSTVAEPLLRDSEYRLHSVRNLINIESPATAEFTTNIAVSILIKCIADIIDTNESVVSIYNLATIFSWVFLIIKYNTFSVSTFDTDYVFRTIHCAMKTKWIPKWRFKNKNTYVFPML